MGTPPTPFAVEIESIVKRYGISPEEAAISLERRKVYGDPFVNHTGIAMGWAGLLQPWAAKIAAMEPLPPHVVALMMATLKTNRMRQAFKEDNYIDASVYLAFARAWQKEYDADLKNVPKETPS